MNGRTITRLALLPLVSLFVILTACKGVGIFAYIAVSDPIDDGLLPKGTSASKIVQISAEYSTTHYDYFSSGSSLFRRNTDVRSTVADGRSWTPLALPSGWTNIQSIAASENRLLLALARESGGILSVGLFYYSNAKGFEEVANTPFTGTSSGYNNVLIYSPNPKDVFYVNVLSFSGDFGHNSTFTGSTMYTFQDAAQGPDWNTHKTVLTSWNAVLNATQKSYVSSAAYSGTTYLFTTVNPSAGTGVLVDQNGVTVDNRITLPSTALTWLPGVNNTGGAFIISSMAQSGGNYKIYVNNDNANGAEGNWVEKNSPYRFDSFLDIRTTQGGGLHADSTKLVLAGTRSIGKDRTGNGYMEIDVSDANPTNWTIRTSRSSFSFADTTNYESGSLVKSSVVGLSLFKENGTGNSYVYASTDQNKIWRINADAYTGNKSRPGWSGE